MLIDWHCDVMLPVRQPLDNGLNESFIGETLGNPTFISTFVKA